MADINILIVVDGIFTFGPQVTAQPQMGQADQRDVNFSITQLMKIFDGSLSPSIAYKKAHRQTDPSGANYADFSDFNFATSVDLTQFDEIWMLGHDGTNIDVELPPPNPPPGQLTFVTADEVRAVAEFMEGGGGVLATGDHEGLGSLMCGLIPRVRSMRLWFSQSDTDTNIPAAAGRNWVATGPYRADTLRAAADQSWHFDNQSDDIPQTLTFPAGTTHPILQGAAGPLRGFPDHMHEGEVILPWTMGDPLHWPYSQTAGDTRLEYPTVAGHQEAPVIVASGNTIGGHTTRTDGATCEQNNFKDEQEPTHNPGFGVDTLCVYDGHKVNVGRIVTDSSFHHYMDLNLIGDPCAPPSPDTRLQGFTTAAGKPYMDDMKAFFVNTAAWLARVRKTCSFVSQNSAFGKDQVQSLGLPATFKPAFWVQMDGFLPSELGIDANGDPTLPGPTVTFAIDSPAAQNAAVVQALVANGQLKIAPIPGPVVTQSLPPDPNTPQRFLYPFQIVWSGVDGFVLPTETLTMTASITVDTNVYQDAKSAKFQASAPLTLTLSANPYVTHVDAKNDYTSWLATDLRVFTVDDDVQFFGHKVSDFYPAGNLGYPLPPQDASKAATTYIAKVIADLTQHNGAAGANTYENDLSETEAGGRNQLEFLQVNPRTDKAAFNFAICRVRIRGTTPTGPGTTQAANCRVFFRSFQAQNTVSTFATGTTYRETPIVPNYGRRVPLPGVQTDAAGKAEYVTLPYFAVDRINLNGPTDLTTQPADAPNVQTIAPISGQEVDTFYGVWLDFNQPTPLFPQYAPPGDFDNVNGEFGKPGFALQSIMTAFNRAPHQCLIAEVAFDDIIIPLGSDSANSDKLAQRNLAYIDGPNPGVAASRRMPYPVQVRATPPEAARADELMIAWGATPKGSTASLYLPGLSSAEIVKMADALYPGHYLRASDPHTLEMAVAPATFVPLPKANGLSAGLLAGLLTVDLAPGIRRGDAYKIAVRHVSDIAPRTDPPITIAARRRAARAAAAPPPPNWRRVVGAFQIDILISIKHQILPREEHLYALFQSVRDGLAADNRWRPVMDRYVDVIRGRVEGFGGDPGRIPPSPVGHVPGLPGGGLGPHPGGGHGGDRDHDRFVGKIVAIRFDRFGDFEGFTVETRSGRRHFFRAGEARVLLTVRTALEARTWVAAECDDDDRLATLTILVDSAGD
jgi:hypothetical protein